MKRFLLISGIICLLAVLISGCGQSSSDGNGQASDQTAKTTKAAVEPTAPEAEKTGDMATPKEATPPPAMEDTGKTKAVVETTKQAVVDVGTGDVPDIIEMKNTTAFSTHTRGIVTFPHSRHAAVKPDGYGIACGECHHDKNGHPLALKPRDAGQGCIACHTKTERPKKPGGMSRDDWKAMQLEYYYGAIHANCIDCHRSGGAGPVKCTECHLPPKK